MARGATISGIRYGPVRIVVESNEGENHWLLVTICQGKNREVRNIMSHLGPKVSRLNRVEYGPLSLGRPPPAGQRSKSKINRAEGVVSIIFAVAFVYIIMLKRELFGWWSRWTEAGRSPLCSISPG